MVGGFKVIVHLRGEMGYRERFTYADEMEPLDPLDIIERAFDRSGADNEGDDELYRWIDPVYMDGVENLPDSLAESHA